MRNTDQGNTRFQQPYLTAGFGIGLLHIETKCIQSLKFQANPSARVTDEIICQSVEPGSDDPVSFPVSVAIWVSCLLKTYKDNSRECQTSKYVVTKC